MKRQEIDKFLSIELRINYSTSSLKVLWAICDDYQDNDRQNSRYTFIKYREL